MGFLAVIGFLLGIALSFSLALLFTGIMLKKSNDFGDYTGTYYHFASEGISYTVKENNVRR